MTTEYPKAYTKFKELCPNMIPISEEEENLIIENVKKSSTKQGRIGQESVFNGYDDW